MDKFFGKNLAQLRHAHNMTLQDVANQVGGVTRQGVFVWEHDNRAPKYVYLVRLAKVFNVDPQFFFTDLSTTLEEGAP